MTRFNKYINGEREEKYDPANEVEIKDEKEIKLSNAQKEYEEYHK